MNLSPEQITIAVTVYNRRQFVKQAIASALNQTVPVRVIVVEDCGPDPTLEAFIKDEFGSRITYFRNSKRRGLFDNWNACLEFCQTEWISILHDDDFLEPCFISEMLALSEKIPGRHFYFGGYQVVDAIGAVLEIHGTPLATAWREIAPVQLAWNNPIKFPGQLFKVQSALEIGGFRKTSQYCGDWEMWFKLALHRGAAMTDRVVAHGRNHQLSGRGTMTVDLNGKRYPLMHTQAKRNLSLLRQQANPELVFNRSMAVSHIPFTTDFLLANARHFSDRMLNYNVRLFMVAPARSKTERILRTGVQILGPQFMRLASHGWRFAWS